MATTEDIQKLLAPFEAKYISERVIRGDKLSYVSQSEVTRRLLEVDPNWSIYPAYLDGNGEPIYERCPQSGTPTGAWFVLTICGLSKTIFGSYAPAVKAEVLEKLKTGEVKWSPLMDPDAPKKILSDAISTGSMRWGVALDLWSKITPNSLEENELQDLKNAIKLLVVEGDEQIKTFAKQFLGTNKLVDLDVYRLKELFASLTGLKEAGAPFEEKDQLLS